VSGILREFAKRGYKLPSAIHQGPDFVLDRSIHSEEAIRFSTEILKMPAHLVKILKEGYKPKLSRLVPRYFENNNKSALDNAGFVRQKIDEWLQAGFAEEIPAAAYCNNPLSVAQKYDPVQDKIKLRPVLDLSRHFNDCVEDQPVQLDDLSRTEFMLEPNDFIIVFDLKNQFCHVRLHPEVKKYFGFSFADDSGRIRFYQFRVMIYGFKTAVAVVTKLLAPVKAYLHKLGVRNSIYVDDGKTCGRTAAETYWKQVLVLTVVQLGGWSVQWEKTDFSPVQKLCHQGVIIDTVNMRYSAVEEKVILLQGLLKIVIANAEAGRVEQAKVLALVLGKTISFLRSHGPIVQVLSRAAQHQLGQAVFHRGWETTILLHSGCIAEFRLLFDALTQFNGQFIPHAGGGAAVELEKIRQFCDLVRYSTVELPNLFVSDASDTAAFVYRADGTFQCVTEFSFDEEQRTCGSGLRELLAVRLMLQNEPDYFRRLAGQKVYWQTDSQNCFGFLIRGSRKPHIQAVVREIKLLEKSFDILLIPVWTPRSHERIVIAVLGSKFSLSTDEWSVARPALWAMLYRIEMFPSVDAFATQYNCICPCFFSRSFDSLSAGTNFFLQPLNVSDVYFCCPPVSLIIPVFRRMQNSPGVKFVLIVPDWPAQCFWPVLFPTGGPAAGEFRVKKFRAPFFFANRAESRVFTAHPTFDLLVIFRK